MMPAHNFQGHLVYCYADLSQRLRLVQQTLLSAFLSPVLAAVRGLLPGSSEGFSKENF